MNTIKELLEKHSQQHVIRWWDELSATEQQQLTHQINSTDFDLIHTTWQQASHNGQEAKPAVDRVDKAIAPQNVIRPHECTTDTLLNAQSTGEQLLAGGKVAVITVAGGQGTRLGFDHPKGMFPIGPLSDRTLFQIFAEQISALRQRHGGAIPWLIMTSAATHDETVQFFQAEGFFGLSSDSVHFFQQASLPAVDANTGKLLMNRKSSLCMSPDGHGGVITALRTSGLLDQLQSDGIEHVFYHQVDNPTVIICAPILIGLHKQQSSELTTNVVKKVSPSERMGVLVDVDGHLEVIEYSELTEEQAASTDEEGQWIFWAGNTAIHIFRLELLDRLSAGDCMLELHVAHKKVPFVDESGNLISPDNPNANKFERFIFDALPQAKNALVVEGNREREFNPVKNAEGSDSPQTARNALSRIGREWLDACGQTLSDSQDVEISPLVALDQNELADKLSNKEISVEDLTGTR